MTRRIFTVTLNVEVYDEAELKEASRRRAIGDGIDEDDWLESHERGGPAYDLQMLLDPGSMHVAGCSILNSGCEEY